MNFLFLAFIALLNLQACEGDNIVVSDLVGSKKIGKEIFNDVKSILWDEVYIYGPYTSADRIREKHSKANLKRLDRALNFNHNYIKESVCYLVFLKENKVVREVLVKRNLLDLSLISKTSPVIKYKTR